MGAVDLEKGYTKHFSLSVLKNFMNYCLYKIRFIMERLVLVTVLMVASTIASPVVDRAASKARSLDSIGGGNILRNLDSIGGGHILRQLDSIGGGHILRDLPDYHVPRYQINNEKRGYDPLRGMTFGVQKKNFDEMDRSGFNNFVKKNFDSMDRVGFNNFVKKNFDSMDRVGFNNFVKKNFDSMDRVGFNNFVKKNFDEMDRMGFNDFS